MKDAWVQWLVIICLVSFGECGVIASPMQTYNASVMKGSLQRESFISKAAKNGNRKVEVDKRKSNKMDNADKSDKTDPEKQGNYLNSLITKISYGVSYVMGTGIYFAGFILSKEAFKLLKIGFEVLPIQSRHSFLLMLF